MELYDVVDPRFATLIDPGATLHLIDATSRWAEGPVYLPATRQLLWSDVRSDRMLRWDERSGAVEIYRAPSSNANGNTLDRTGRLVTCEHLTRRVVRTEHNGSFTVIADRFEGKRLNSPNDVVVAADGAIWFTDPTYGIEGRHGALAIADASGDRFLGAIGLGPIEPHRASIGYWVAPAERGRGLATDRPDWPLS